jgi:hypothetical protein
MKKLHISDNNRYFVQDDGAPFIWLADTAWTMPQRLKWDDVDYYMKKRKEQGFTVLQIVALDPEMDEEMRNPVGKKALINNNLLTPNEAYFEYLDWILDKTEEYGFHVLLLPAWGQLIVGHNWMGQTFEKTVTEKNAHEYGCWIGNRYKERENIIWCLGGDRQPIHLGVDYKNVWRRMAEGLAKGITGKELKYNASVEEWKELTITYHACHEMETGECSTMSYWSDEEAWISFIMLQSGHGTIPKNYELVKKEYDRSIVMPVWDGEPAYEMMPTTWPVIKDFHDDWIVRKRAYWSLFAGSFGHTYGHASVWCMISEKEKNKMSQYSWFEALEHPGAYQIKILRDFLESRDLSACVPAQGILKLQKEKEEELSQHIQACTHQKGSFACIYFPSGGIERIDVKSINSVSLNLWWFNPRDGKCYLDATTETEEPIKVQVSNQLLEVETPTQGSKEDWVLVLEAAEQEYGAPGKSKSYYKMDQEGELKKVFEW